jgi:hypothetical protein
MLKAQDKTLPSVLGEREEGMSLILRVSPKTDQNEKTREF